MVRLALLGIVAVIPLFPVYAQVTLFPYNQDFDSIVPPMLPPGWASTHNRYPLEADFSTTSTSACSPPNAVLARNATLGQALLTPVFDFSNGTPESISFYCRRSSSFRASLVLELSTDGGASFPISVGDTLKPDAGFGQYVFSHIPLPDTLGSVRSVVIRWRVVPDTAGSSGTIRFDDVAVHQQLHTDLEVSLVRFMPNHPTEDEDVDAMVRVHNRGGGDVTGFTLLLARDANGDSVVQEGEILADWRSTSTLVSGDSIEVAASIGLFPPGEHRCIVICVCDGDQRISNNTVYRDLSVGYRPGTIRINEVMYAPTGTEPEWVELFNAARNTVNVEQWQLADRSGGLPRTLAATPTNLEPAAFILLTRDSAALRDLHPDITGTVLWVPRLPTLNNSGDEVVLYDKNLRTMDSVCYEPSWGGSKDGRSLERIDPWRSSTLRSNWGSSVDSTGSTPGRENSIARKNHDLAICSLALSPKAPSAGQPLDVLIGIRNTGREEVRGFSLSLYDDANRDSIPFQGELVGNRTEAIVLGSEDSCVVVWRVTLHRSGVQQYIVILNRAGDENGANNIAVLRTFIHAAPGVVRINEVMYAPTDGLPEWVELTNISPDTVGLEGWTIGNRNISSRYELPARTFLLPDHYLVVVKDTAGLRHAFGGACEGATLLSSLPTSLWNNGGDAVVLRDPEGSVMDSLFYRPSWGGNEGTSLERIDAEAASDDSVNWSSSKDHLGGTPGWLNSVMRLTYDIVVGVATQEHLFPQIPGVISVTLRNPGKTATDPFDLFMYHDVDGDSSGAAAEVVVRTAVTIPVVPLDSLCVSLVWEPPDPGTHTMMVVADWGRDLRKSNNTVFISVEVSYPPGSLVINEFLYEPLPGNAEFVELLNTTNRSIDVSGWSIRDEPTASGGSREITIAGRDLLLGPEEFFLIASDSTLFAQHPSLEEATAGVFVPGSAGLGLNNNGDSIILCDPSGGSVDNLLYDASWHNPSFLEHRGRSLEKLAPFLPSGDARNWSTCVDPAGATPGKPNSLYTPVPPRQSHLSFSPNPFSPDNDGMDDFVVVLYELPVRTDAVSVTVYDSRGRLIRRLLTAEAGTYRGEVVWDGRDDEQGMARVGIYVVVLEAIDEKGGSMVTERGVVVLACALE
jgi:hypothetical protein